MDKCPICGLQPEDSDCIVATVQAGQTTATILDFHPSCYNYQGKEFLQKILNKIQDDFDVTARSMGLSSLPAGNSVYAIVRRGRESTYWVINADDAVTRLKPATDALVSMLPLMLAIIIIVPVLVFGSIYALTKDVISTIFWGILVLVFLVFLLWILAKITDKSS